MDPLPMTAFSNDFFTAFANIERETQGKIIDFLKHFRAKPSFSDREYCHIPGAIDSCFYITPVAKTGYYFVVFKPENEELYILLWVDEKDAACEWGKNRTCFLNRMTKQVSIIVKEEIVREVPKEKSLFSSLTKEELLDLGVPEQSIKKVYSVCDKQDLEELKQFVPSLTFESLCLFHAGNSYKDVLEVYQDSLRIDKEETEKKVEKKAKITKKDITRDIEQDPVKQFVRLEYYFNHSQDSFLVNPKEKELLSALQEPLALWRIFLHPSQRNLVEKEWGGSVRVFGSAGTGKTVVALHRAAYLARCHPDAKILFTTFSRTLVVDLQNQLHSICMYDEDRNIEVINIDAWVNQFLRREGITFDMRFASGQEDDFWRQAMSLLPDDNINEQLRTTKFFKEEWEQVIEWHGITTEKEYLHVSRTGRKVHLQKKDRMQIWPVFAKFRELLDEYKIIPFGDAARKACEIIEKRIEEGEEHPYSFVIVDECQDMSEQDIRLIRALVPVGENDIFLVGDPYQRIYGYPVPLSRFGINISGRSRKLYINYRTTEQIRREAIAFLPEELGDEDRLDARNVSLSFGPQVERREFCSQKEAIRAIADEILGLKRINQGLNLSEICVVARHQRIFDEDFFQEIFEDRELNICALNAMPDNAIEGVRLATMHRVKGLEFNHIFILESQRELDALDNNEDRLKENMLRYVASSRAKISLHIYSYEQS